MKKSYLIFLSLIILFVFNNNIYSQWHSVENGSTTDIYEFKFKNENTGWYISNRKQIYKTTTGGLYWHCLDIPYVDTLDYLHNLNVIGDTLWMSINGRRALKSTNGGDNWSVINSINNHNLITCSIVRNNLIFALIDDGIQSSQIIKTNNIFNNQVPIFNINSAGFYDINSSSDLDFVNDSIGYLRGEWRLYKTTNGGYNWFTVFFDSVNINSPTFDYIKFIDKDNGFLHYGFFGLYKTTNGGVNWQYIMNMSYKPKIIIKDSMTGYMMPIMPFYNKFYKTTNGGINWNLQFYDTASINGTFADFDYTGNTFFVAAGGAGNVLKSTNEGIIWTKSSPYFREEGYTAMCFVNAQTGFIGTTDDYLLKTTNAGINWLLVDTLCTPSYYSSKWIDKIQFTDEYNGWLLDDSGFYKTTNSGNNWIYKGWTPTVSNVYKTSNSCNKLIRKSSTYSFSKLSKTTNSANSRSHDTIHYPSYFYFMNNTTGFAFCPANINETNYTVLFKTTNGGDNFFLTHYLNDSGFEIKFYDSLYGYILCNSILNGPELYRTTDGGFNWEPNYEIGFIGCIFIQNRNVAYIGEAFLNNSGGIIKTTNGGDNWFRVLNNGNYFSSILFTDENVGFAIGDKSFYYTTNAGKNWTYSFIGMNSLMYNLCRPSQDVLIVIGSDGKIYRSTNYGGIFIGINHNEISIPKGIRLYQNYPNPFNPTTKIKFDVPVDSRIRGNDRDGLVGNGRVLLKVYDILGKEIETLVNEKLNPGTYEVTFNASQYPSGVYFYRLQAGDYNESKKMLLVK